MKTEEKSDYYKSIQNNKSSFLLQNGMLTIKGLSGIGTIEIYNIIGNKIVFFENVSLANFKQYVPLENNNMYIIRVLHEGKVKTFKIVAK